tara:strand:- start:86 stop:424 length:339 start_codon:yes stop_codon:yes gene_type:complete
MNLIINEDNSSTIVKLDITKACLCCNMLCEEPSKPRDMILPDGEIVKGMYKFIPEDNIVWICELALSLDVHSYANSLEVITGDNSASNDMLFSMMASTAEIMNNDLYLTIRR